MAKRPRPQPQVYVDPDEEREEQDFNPEPIAEVFTALSRATITEPGWVVKDLIPEGLVILGAPPKSLKSTFVLGVSGVVAGYAVNVLPPGMNEAQQHGTVLGFSAEASAGVLRHMAEHGLGMTLPDDDRILIADDPWLFQLDEEDGVKKLLYWLNAKKPKLCFIDPFAEFHSLEEKDSRAMIQILRPLHRWAIENRAAIVIVHHLRKPGQQHEGPYTALDLRGSTAIFGKMDGVLIFTPHEDKPGLITIDAKFKRGASWRRDVQFKAYGAVGEAPATEVLDDVSKMVLGVIVGGVTKHSLIAKQLKVGKLRVGTAIEALVRAGRVAKVGKKLIVCSKASKKPKQRRKDK